MTSPRLLFLLPLLLTALLHLVPGAGGFLSDDFAHLHWIHEAAQRGELTAWLLGTFNGPLPSGNFAYRPLVFVSYAIDYRLFGAAAAGWHATNLAIHLLCAALAGALAQRLARLSGHDALQTVARFALALVALTPLAGESTLWPVGRFDLMACAFSLLFLLLCASDAPVRFSRRAAMAAALLAALLSKESALPMLAVGVALSAALAWRRMTFAGALREAAAAHFLNVALLVAYLGWRVLLFGSAWKVYPASSAPASLDEAWTRIATLGNIAPALYGVAAPVAVVIAVLAAGVAVAMVLRESIASRRDRLIECVVLMAAVAYALAPASSFPVIGPEGEGVRNLYIAWVLGAVGLSMCFAAGRAGRAAGVAFLLVAAAGHVLAVRHWQAASADMRAVDAAIPAFAESLSDRQFALLLLPDHQGAAPFLRNAQGGIAVPPVQARDYTGRLVGMTPIQFDEWNAHFAKGTVARLKQAPFAMADFAGVACWSVARGAIVRLDAAHSNDAAAWREAVMAEAATKDCAR